MELPNVIRPYPLLNPERKKLKVVEAGGGQVSPSKHIDTNGQTFTKAKRIRDAINKVPGARATGFGEFVGFHIEAQGITEMIKKLQQIDIPEFKTQSKLVCDGDPVRIN